jgi:hypothetical protein
VAGVLAVVPLEVDPPPQPIVSAANSKTNMTRAFSGPIPGPILELMRTAEIVDHGTLPR